MLKRVVLLIMCLILCAAVVFQPSAFHSAPATAAEADTKNIFMYDLYDGFYNYGDYYEINYILKIYKDTADAVNARYGDGVNKIFDSIEQFFYAYEKLFFNNANAKIARYKDVTKYNAATNPYYIFNMYICFSGDEKTSAGNKLGEYFCFGGGSIEPKKTFFTNRYEKSEPTHFAVPEGMPEYGAFKSAYYNFADIRQLAGFNAVMMPFLLYGWGAGTKNNTKFADENLKNGYKGLVNEFDKYFDGRDTSTRAKMFKNYDLGHSVSCSTRYLKTDADYKDSSMGEYFHVWEVSFNGAEKYDPNREITITYVQPRVINLYYFAIIISAGFIAIMVLCFYVPYDIKKNKEQK